MSGIVFRFWGSALLLAAAVALGAAYGLPYERLRLDTALEQRRAWLLTLWTVGVLAILFGASGLLAFAAPLGFREVAEAGTLTGAQEARRQAQGGTDGFHRNFAWWLVSFGGLMVALYFAAWSLDLGR